MTVVACLAHQKLFFLDLKQNDSSGIFLSHQKHSLAVNHFACQSLLTSLWRVRFCREGVSLFKNLWKTAFSLFTVRDTSGARESTPFSNPLGSPAWDREKLNISLMHRQIYRGRKYAEIKKSVPGCTVEGTASLSKSSSLSLSPSCSRVWETASSLGKDREENIIV